MSVMDDAAYDGTVLLGIATFSPNAGEDVYRARLSPPMPPRVIAHSTNGSAFGPDGSVYYVNASDHLVRLTAGGDQTVGPTVGLASPTYVFGGFAWVGSYGQGSNMTWTTYDDISLKLVHTWRGDVAERFAGAPAGGGLALWPGGTAGCLPPDPNGLGASCVGRLSAAGVLSVPTPVGYEASVLLLPRGHKRASSTERLSRPGQAGVTLFWTGTTRPPGKRRTRGLAFGEERKRAGICPIGETAEISRAERRTSGKGWLWLLDDYVRTGRGMAADGVFERRDRSRG